MIFVDLLPLIRTPVSLGLHLSGRLFFFDVGFKHTLLYLFLQVGQIPDGNHVFTGQFRCLRVFNTKVPHL